MERLSPAQYTILRSMAPREGSGPQPGLPLDKAIEFNQIMFYSLLRRGFIRLNMGNGTFLLSKDGLDAFNHYTRGNVKDYLVKDESESRHLRVESKLTGKPIRKRAKAQLKTVPAHAAVA